jgi:hypothetical protein
MGKTLALEEAGSLAFWSKMPELSRGLFCLALHCELEGPSNWSYSVADALAPDI